jgi:hypothetical protein
VYAVQELGLRAEAIDFIAYSLCANLFVIGEDEVGYLVGATCISDFILRSSPAAEGQNA